MSAPVGIAIEPLRDLRRCPLRPPGAGAVPRRGPPGALRRSGRPARGMPTGRSGGGDAGRLGHRPRRRAAEAEAEIHTIGVDPASQGRGIGRALLRGLLVVADGVQATVFLEVRTDNDVARALYESEGFGLWGCDGITTRPAVRTPTRCGEGPAVTGTIVLGIETSCDETGVGVVAVDDAAGWSCSPTRSRRRSTSTRGSAASCPRWPRGLTCRRWFRPCTVRSRPPASVRATWAPSQ